MGRRRWHCRGRNCFVWLRKYTSPERNTKKSQAGHSQRKTHGNTPQPKLSKTRERQESPKAAKRKESHTSTYVDIRWQTHAHTYTHIHTVMHVYIQAQTHAHTIMQVHMYVLASLHAYVHTSTCVCVLVHEHTHKHKAAGTHLTGTPAHRCLKEVMGLPSLLLLKTEMPCPEEKTGQRGEVLCQEGGTEVPLKP